jgi:hypothetical protein
MKKLIASAILAASVGSGYAANLDLDTKSVGFSGLIDFTSVARTHVDFALSLGYFVADYAEVGLRANVEDDDFTSRWAIGAYGEYNFEIGSPLFPYVGAGLNISGADLKVTQDADNNSGVELDLRLGSKYFLLEDLAVDAAISLRVASTELYADDTEADTSDWRMLFALRYFFD